MTARLRSLSALASLLFLPNQPASLLAAAQVVSVSPPAVAVDIKVTHTMVNPDGSQAGPASMPTSFSLERRHTPSGWTTVLTYRTTPGAPAGRTMASPLEGARLEYDDGARAVRVYDGDGRLNTRLSQENGGASLPVFDGAARWLDALLAHPRQSDERLETLRQAYGSPVSRVGGLDRYLSRGEGDVVNEVLADPRTGVVKESSAARGGALHERVEFDYGARPDGTLFRRRIRTEHALAAPAQGRSVVTVEFSNLAVGSAR